MNWKKTVFYDLAGNSIKHNRIVTTQKQKEYQLMSPIKPNFGYIEDRATVTQVLKSLPTGTTVSIVNDTINNGYVEIRLQDGSKGYAFS